MTQVSIPRPSGNGKDAPIHARTTVAVIGGGPIGSETAIARQEVGVVSILFEARQIGDAFMKWPPHTHFYSTPEHVALAGLPVHTLDQRPISGEEYLAYLRTLVEFFDLDLHNYEPVRSIERVADGFVLETEKRGALRRYQARYVVLCTGGMARPRRLHIPGEDLPHVSHYFPGPHVYFRTRLLVVGGRNSALESALRSWRAGAQVSISYRRADFPWDIVKPHLADDIRTRLQKGEIGFYPATLPVEITPTHVVLAHTEDGVTPQEPLIRHEADFVLLATGFEADMSLCERAGVALEGPERAPVHDPETMETNVPGLYVAGTVVGGTQMRFRYFISTSHDHVVKVVRAISGRTPRRVGTVPGRNNAVTWREVRAN